MSHLCAQTTRPGRLGAALVPLVRADDPTRATRGGRCRTVRADDPIQATRAGRCHTCARKRPNQWWIKRRPRGQPCEGRLLVCAPASIAHARRLSRNGQRSRSTLVREPGQICDATRRADSGARVFLAAYGSSASTSPVMTLGDSVREHQGVLVAQILPAVFTGGGAGDGRDLFVVQPRI